MDYVLVAGPVAVGEPFIGILTQKGIPFAILTSSISEQEQWTKLGVERVLLIDTAEPDAWVSPKHPIGNVFLFEDTTTLCRLYLNIVRTWSTKSVYVITPNKKSTMIYKTLGADYVMYSKTGDVSFLINW